MEQGKKSGSFASKHPFWYDVATIGLAVSAGVVIGGLALTAINTWVMPSLQSWTSSAPAAPATVAAKTS